VLAEVGEGVFGLSAEEQSSASQGFVEGEVLVLEAEREGDGLVVLLVEYDSLGVMSVC